MVLFDSNIIISASKPDNVILRDFIVLTQHSISIVSKIEVLGYSNISYAEHTFLDEYFAKVSIIELTHEIVEVAIALRKIRRLTLGDSVIAATARFMGIPLVTNSEKDFSWIEGLTIINPLKQ